MSIPTHTSNCYTKTYKTKCPDCRENVFFFSCTCGSKIFFDKLGSPWTQHYCIQCEIRESIQLIQDSSFRTDNEIFNKILKHALELNKPIPPEYYEILENELSYRRKEIRIIKIKVDDSIEGFSGKICEINKDINFEKKYKKELQITVAPGFLGELSEKKFNEIIIRENPDKEGHVREYNCFISTDDFVKSFIRKDDIVSAKVRISKSYYENWIVESIKKV